MAVQLPKKHLPWVGLLSVAMVALAGGTIFYYQFVIPHAPCAPLPPPAHRMIFLNAIIHELGGFTIKNAAYLNQTTLPDYSNTTGPIINSTIQYTNYRVSDNNTIDANVGDNVTIYYHSIDSGLPPPQQVSSGHGFSLGDPFFILQNLIPWVSGPQGNWWSVTFTVKQTGTTTFRCANVCSPEHTQMTGSLVVHGCG